MSDVINLDDHRPHLGGPARCLACGHSWQAVAPIGTLYLECPECGTERGTFHRPCIPDSYFQCNCGCSAFALSPDEAICMTCGVPAVFPG